MMKINYQAEQDKIIKGLTIKPKLLLHACCGPCSSACIERLSEHFLITVFWYDPCIHPEAEYVKRLENLKKLIVSLDTPEPVDLLEAEYEPQSYFERIKGLENEPEGGERCTVCFTQRLERTAKEASARGFDYFTTTLTVSPHKDAERINRIGYEAAEHFGSSFLPSDFKKKNGYLRSIELSRMFDLYRQDYCGCVYSMRSE